MPTLVRNSAMTPIDYSVYFSDLDTLVGDRTHTFKQFGSVTNRTTAVGAGTDGLLMEVASSSNISVGDYITGDNGATRSMVRTKGGNFLELLEPLTWLNNADIATVAVGNATVSGLSLSSGGVLSGTPDTAGTTADVFIRVADEHGTYADTNGFDVVVEDPPLSATWDAVFNNQNDQTGIPIVPINLDDYSSNATSYTSIGASLPPGISIVGNFLQGTPTTPGVYTLLQIRANGGGGNDSSNLFTWTITTPVVESDTAGWTVPDRGEGVEVRQSIVFQEYTDILVAGIRGLDCVLSGCQVAPNTDMVIQVTKGAVLSRGIIFAVAEDVVTISTADSALPRIDIVVVTEDGTLAVRAGTPAPIPKPGAREVGDVGLAAVYVAPNNTSIGDTEITDMRVLRTQGPITIKKLTTPVAFNTTAAEQTIFSVVLPNGLFLEGRRLLTRISGNVLLNSGTPTLTIKIKYGGSILYEVTSAAAVADSDRRAWDMDLILSAATSGTQRICGHIFMGGLSGTTTPPTTGLGDVFGESSHAGAINGSSSVDSDVADRTFEVTMTMSVSNAANEVLVQQAVAQLS